MQNSGHERLISPIRRVVELLVDKKYDELERMTGGQRLTSVELRQAVIEYGRTLTMPPEGAWDRLDVIDVKDRDQPTYSVRFDLWANGRPSDLSIEATLIQISPTGEFKIEIDDLHVL